MGSLFLGTFPRNDFPIHRNTRDGVWRTRG